ncbi:MULTISPECIES: hypothetical protein [unclassified Endozoicomonas]|uniref:hypothetical protein n=1 Tax=unclassified Endozoicomonas TaxID=2644528 RepID=UPI003BB73EFE
MDWLEPDSLSPAISPGIDDLSASQNALCDFLKLDAQRVVASARVKPDYVSVQPEALVDRAQEVPSSSSVTVGQLLASAEELRKKAHEKAMEQKLRQQQEKAATVAANEDACWRRVEELFEKRRSSTVYSELSAELGDLQLMAKMLDRQTTYDRKLAELKQRYAKKTSHWQGLRCR